MHTHTYAAQITHTDLAEERRVGPLRGLGTSLGEHRQTIRVLAPVPLTQEGSSLPPSHSCSSASHTFQGRKDPVGQAAGLDSILHTPRLSLSFSSVEWGSLLWCDSVIDDTHTMCFLSFEPLQPAAWGNGGTESLPDLGNFFFFPLLRHLCSIVQAGFRSAILLLRPHICHHTQTEVLLTPIGVFHLVYGRQLTG